MLPNSFQGWAPTRSSPADNKARFYLSLVHSVLQPHRPPPLLHSGPLHVHSLLGQPSPSFMPGQPPHSSFKVPLFPGLSLSPYLIFRCILICLATCLLFGSIVKLLRGQEPDHNSPANTHWTDHCPLPQEPSEVSENVQKHQLQTSAAWGAASLGSGTTSSPLHTFPNPPQHCSAKFRAAVYSRHQCSIIGCWYLGSFGGTRSAEDHDFEWEGVCQQTTEPHPPWLLDFGRETSPTYR